MELSRAELRKSRSSLMIGSRENSRSTGQTAEFYYEQHWRTHKWWVATILALYAGLVSIGIIATVAHRSMVTQSGRPAVEALLEKAAR
jgi:hypothetical protein